MHDFSFLEIKQVDWLCYAFSKFLEGVFESNKNIQKHNSIQFHHMPNIHSNFVFLLRENEMRAHTIIVTGQDAS